MTTENSEEGATLAEVGLVPKGHGINEGFCVWLLCLCRILLAARLWLSLDLFYCREGN
jgi:hypothetical protein